MAELLALLWPREPETLVPLTALASHDEDLATRQDVLERAPSDLVRQRSADRKKPKRSFTKAADKPALFTAIRRYAQVEQLPVSHLAGPTSKTTSLNSAAEPGRPLGSRTHLAIGHDHLSEDSGIKGCDRAVTVRAGCRWASRSILIGAGVQAGPAPDLT
ncbi:hypothetical protein [Kitasatospora sp. NPDC057015]|uniref:hypothetical protein n=1 Tax=Kitasatospora sp. NPDC057015 TaxID=3346001 RepID=UPI0036275BBF